MREVDKLSAPTNANYESHREKMAGRQAEQSAKGRDIGDLPLIADLDRRMGTRGSLRTWCETYHGDVFYLPWSDDQLDAIAKLEECVTKGALYAFAMPRGSGKTSLVRATITWAVAHAHCVYPFIIGANIGMARASLEAIKIAFRFNELITVDFPEISHAAIALKGIANRASGQTCNGRATMIEWSREQVVTPTCPLPENHPDYEDGKLSPTSGILIKAAGLTSDGIRGSLHTTTEGAAIRPDLVLIDDPQTPESAYSPTQCNTRERLIKHDVMGMAGPDKKLAAMMPCTVICQGDMADRILNRQDNPDWRGQRTKLMPSMPTNLDAWEKYRDAYNQCLGAETLDLTEANAYYIAHRAELDEGAVHSWPQRYKDYEVSAIQNAMHILFFSESRFYAEYQNDPMAIETSDEGFLDADQIAAKVSGVQRGVVPAECSTLTAFIDVQGEVLYWLVAAWSDGFGGQVVDYGAWPEQKRRHFTLSSLPRSLSTQYPGQDANGRIYAGLMDITDALCGREWEVENKSVAKIARCLIDSGWGDSTTTVHQVCRDSAHAAVLVPSKGVGIPATGTPMGEWKKLAAGDKSGHDWRLQRRSDRALRHALYDTNTWKTMVHRKLATTMGSFGALSLFKAPTHHHRMLAEHCTVEPYSRVTCAKRGRTIVQFEKPTASRDNHLFDCLVGAAVAASMAGIKTTGHEPPKSERKRIRLSDMQKQKGTAA